MNLFLVLAVGAFGLGLIHLRTVKAAAEPQAAQLVPAKVTIPAVQPRPLNFLLRERRCTRRTAGIQSFL